MKDAGISVEFQNLERFHLKFVISSYRYQDRVVLGSIATPKDHTALDPDIPHVPQRGLDKR